MTDPSGYAKTLALPAGFDAPRLLRYDDVTAHAITRDDLGADVRGINASLDLIRETRGGTWPTGTVTEDEEYVDLVRHECESRDGKSFTFCVEAEAAAISAAHTSSRVARSGWSALHSAQRASLRAHQPLPATPALPSAQPASKEPAARDPRCSSQRSRDNVSKT
jgi:hypothetical protein